MRIHNRSVKLNHVLFSLAALCWLLTGCGVKPKGEYVSRGRKVEIVGRNGNFTLMRNGEPYFIKGAGGYTHFEKLAASGGNSVRVWHTEDAQRVLDEAHRHGLTVTLGLWLGREKEGFNYYDKKMVARQLADLREVVLKYKDHPALLMWGVGNEVNDKASSTKVWDAVNEIAEMIHEVDPNHPTTTMLIGVRIKTVNLIIRKCPAIDVLSFNIFGGLPNIKRKIARTEWKGPYIISEFGTYGYWEAQNYTWWGAPLEQTSSEKADFIKARYQKVLDDTSRCLGGYLFYWGYKHEGTPTWFSLLTQDGKRTEAVNVMQELWSGDTSRNRAPHVAYMKLSDAFDFENIFLRPEHDYSAAVYTFDPDGDSLRVEWEVLPEVFDKNGHTTRSTKPAPVPGAVFKEYGDKLHLRAPKAEGAYRLYAYVYDGQGHVSTANIPFYVAKDTPY